jgi:hypothetical protein
VEGDSLPQLDGLRFFAFFLVTGRTIGRLFLSRQLLHGLRRPIQPTELHTASVDHRIRRADLSYFALERPFLRIKRRFTLVPNRQD